MVARFQDNDYGFWVIGELIYWDRSEVPWYREEDIGYECCQVYDAPDPGEGWRLIDPEKESPEEGDELFAHGYWKTRRTKTDPFAKTFYYRRRIEPPKPQPRYEPFRWEDREQLRGRWITYKHEDGTTIETQINHLSEHRLEGFLFKSRKPVWLLENATFLDSGEPVGRRVE